MSDALRCEAEIMLMDDRWGAFTDRCEGELGHTDDHFTVMGATMPLGRLVWPNDGYCLSARMDGPDHPPYLCGRDHGHAGKHKVSSGEWSYEW